MAAGDIEIDPRRCSDAEFGEPGAAQVLGVLRHRGKGAVSDDLAAWRRAAGCADREVRRFRSKCNRPPIPNRERRGHAVLRPDDLGVETAIEFDDLRLTARIPEGGFLLLGPAGTSGDLPLVGSAFFAGASDEGVDEQAKTRESIYVISPVIRSYGGPEPEGGDGRPKAAGGR